MKSTEIIESKVFELISGKLGSKETKLLIKYIKHEVKSNENSVATKLDISELKSDILERFSANNRNMIIGLITLYASTLAAIWGMIKITLP